MRGSKGDALSRYSPEVLERLPYWVKEMLKMLDDAKASKSDWKNVKS